MRTAIVLATALLALPCVGRAQTQSIADLFPIAFHDCQEMTATKDGITCEIRVSSDGTMQWITFFVRDEVWANAEKKKRMEYLRALAVRDFFSERGPRATMFWRSKAGKQMKQTCYNDGRGQMRGCDEPTKVKAEGRKQ